MSKILLSLINKLPAIDNGARYCQASLPASLEAELDIVSSSRKSDALIALAEIGYEDLAAELAKDKTPPEPTKRVQLTLPDSLSEKLAIVDTRTKSNAVMVLAQRGVKVLKKRASTAKPEVFDLSKL